MSVSVWFKEFVKAMKTVLGSYATDVSRVVSPKVRGFLNSFKAYGRHLTEGSLTVAEVRLYLQWDVNNIVIALAAFETITLSAAQQAVDAALAALKGIVEDTLAAAIPG